MGKTLAEMTEEVVANNKAKGWYENRATFPEAMAMLHSEVSEALEAWRKKGLAAWKLRKLETFTPCPACQQQTDVNAPECPDHPDKPEGVASEFADIFIRLLDDAWLFGQVDLEVFASRPGQFALSNSFAANMNTLHDMISNVSVVASDSETYAGLLGAVLVFLRQLCSEYGIDLEAEYERKMAHNRSRAYRHGGKRI